MRNEQEKEKLKLELEKLQVSSAVDIPSVSVGEEGLELGSPAAENDPYQVMKSIAFEPLSLSRQRGRSFNIKDITGGVSGVPTPSDTESSSSVRALNLSPPPSPGVPPELPLLSPATGQHNVVSPSVAEFVDPDMRELLETYEVVENDLGTHPTAPQDESDTSRELTGRSTLALDYVYKNMSEFEVDGGLSRSCPQYALESHGEDQTDSHPTTPEFRLGCSILAYLN